MKYSICGLIVSLCIFSIFTTEAYAQETLIELHPGCNSVSKSRNSDCVAAMHRYCSNHDLGRAGISQEVGGDEIGVACIKENWYGEVPLSELTRSHNECSNMGRSQSGACVAAAHRWCNQTGKGEVGVIQELGNSVFGVACFSAKTYQDVSLASLQNEHSDCNALNKSQTSSCVSAAYRWCKNTGKGGGGFPQEVGGGNRVFGIACFDPTTYKAIKIKPRVANPGGGGGGGGRKPPRQEQ